MRVFAMLIVAAGFTMAADDAKDDDAKKKELEKFQGTWKIVSIERDGKKEEPKDSVATVSGDKFATKSGNDVVREGSLKLIDVSKKAIDVTYTAGPDKGKALQGVYSLVGDKWVLAYAGPDKDRPKSVPTAKGEVHLVLHLERVKPK